jgi:hypothetical protein
MSARKKKEKGESGYLPAGPAESTYVTIGFDGKSWKLIPAESGKGDAAFAAYIKSELAKGATP